MKMKKKKQGRGLLLAVLVLALLLVIYFVMDRKQKDDESRAETEETELEAPVSVTAEELAKVTVKKQDMTMTFERKDDSWTYKEDTEFPLDEAALDTKINRLAGLSVRRVLENPEDLAEYGLDEPSLEITVEKTDNTSFTLYIGDQNNSTKDYYMKVDDGSDVYTIESGIPSAFNMDPYDVSKSEAFPVLETAGIRNIQVEKEDETTEFYTDDTGLVWTLKASDGTDNKVDSTALSELTAAVGVLSYNSFVDYKGEDLTKYGLDAPEAVITVVTEETESKIEAQAETAKEDLESDSEPETNEKESLESESESEAESMAESKEPKVIQRKTVLLVGNTNEKGNYFVKLQDNPEIHTMASSALEKLLNIQKLDYVSPYLNDVPMVDLKSLKVTYQGETRELTIETEHVPVETEASEEETEAVSETEAEPEMKTEYHYLVDGEEADSSAFRSFYNNTVSLQAQKRTEEADAPKMTGEPELKLEFTRMDGTTLTTEYYLANDGLYDVLSDQNLPARVSKMEVQKVIDYYKTLITWEAEPESESERGSETEKEPELEPKRGLETELESDTGLRNETKPDSETELASETESEVDTGTKATSKAKIESQGETETK